MSGGMIFSGVMLMKGEPPSPHSFSLGRTLFLLDLFFNSGLGFCVRDVIRNWRHRTYARQTILRGVVVGLVTLAIALLAFLLLQES